MDDSESKGGIYNEETESCVIEYLAESESHGTSTFYRCIFSPVGKSLSKKW